MEDFWMWLIAALVLLFIEVNTGTFYFLCLAIAALLAGLAALVGGWPLQLGVFGVSTLASLPFVKRLADRFTRQEPPVKVGLDRLIGERGVVIEAIDPARNRGIVKVGGEEWRAISDEYIPEGRTVLVEEVRGNKLFVYREPSWEVEETPRLRASEERPRRLEISETSSEEEPPS